MLSPLTSLLCHVMARCPEQISKNEIRSLFRAKMVLQVQVQRTNTLDRYLQPAHVINRDKYVLLYMHIYVYKYIYILRKTHSQQSLCKKPSKHIQQIAITGEWDRNITWPVASRNAAGKYLHFIPKIKNNHREMKETDPRNP